MPRPPTGIAGGQLNRSVMYAYNPLEPHSLIVSQPKAQSVLMAAPMPKLDTSAARIPGRRGRKRRMRTILTQQLTASRGRVVEPYPAVLQRG